MVDVPHSIMTGDITDISPLCNFGWYKWTNYRKLGEEVQCPYPTERLGVCLGRAKNKGDEMIQHIPTVGGIIIPIQTIRSLTTA